MIRRLQLVACLIAVISVEVMAQNTGSLAGEILGVNKEPLYGTNIQLLGTRLGASSNQEGKFKIPDVPEGNYQVNISAVGYEGIKRTVAISAGKAQNVSFLLYEKTNELSEVEVFGERDRQPEKLQSITRLPLKPSDQIQSISIISEELINQQGALSIIDATRNVTGVYAFATYGNRRESLGGRGFRGLPILKNGVRVHSDFRGQGILSDMQGVESIQVIKGVNAITQGAGTDLGSPGGVINIVSKTPKYYSGGFVSFRAGSFGQTRPVFDVYGPIGAAKNLAYRFNGAFEKTGNFRKGVSMERIYFNPSLEWMPDEKTQITLEMDYFNDSRTPDQGTIALSEDEYSIFDLPFDRFLGFDSDRSITKNTTFAARFKRDLPNNLAVRVAYFHSNLELSEISSYTSPRGIVGLPTQYRARSMSRSGRTDKNSVLQFDLMGKDVPTGRLKHTFQVGMDLGTNYLELPSYSSAAIDTINVFENISNKLESAPSFELQNTTASDALRVGLMAQDVISLTRWLRTVIGFRYSIVESKASNANEIVRNSGFTPQLGLLVRVKDGFNLFASYTNVFNPRTAAVVDKEGATLGNERTDQFEVGLKSDWLDNRLRFNLTLFQTNNRNMNLRAFEKDENGVVVEMPYYIKGGNDERKGVETEIMGRINEKWEIVAGYAYINAKYKEHTTFVSGSSPHNTPNHTFNIWTYYTFRNGLVKGLSLGAGAYHIGERPINDWTTSGANFHDITPGLKPYNLKAYTLVNLVGSYSVKRYGFRVQVNNIFDQKGYDAYRTSYINPVAPRNLSGAITYTF